MACKYEVPNYLNWQLRYAKYSLANRAQIRINNPGQKGLGHFPLFSLFYIVETAENQQFTVMQIALKRFFPRSPWTMLKSFVCRILLIHLWLPTTNIFQGGEGIDWNAFFIEKWESVPNVLGTILFTYLTLSFWPQVDAVINYFKPKLSCS